MYVFIVFIYLQAIFVIKDQFSLDLRNLIGDIVSVRQNVKIHMSGCKVNMFVMHVQVLYRFYRCLLFI